MCTAGRRPPTYQLAVPFSRACLLRFTSGLEQYTNAIVLGVLFRVRRRGSAACGREVYRKWWMLTFVMITLDADPLWPAPTLKASQTVTV